MSDKRPTAGEQSTMGLYLRELRRIPRLSAEEEQAFAALAAQGDQKARQRLIQANLRFVILVAKRYRNRGVPLEDLVNEGNIGLIRAAERFDPDRGVRFVSYAVWWIRQAILKAIPENGRLIRVPRSRAGELSRIAELRMQAAQGTLSLDSPVTDMENPDPFGACLEDRSVPKPEEVLVGASLQERAGFGAGRALGSRGLHPAGPLRACRQQTHLAAGGRQEARAQQGARAPDREEGLAQDPRVRRRPESQGLRELKEGEVMIRVLMVGYNGANNTGAEALLAVRHRGRAGRAGPEAHITVPSLNPANLRRYLAEGPTLRIVADAHPVLRHHPPAGAGERPGAAGGRLHLHGHLGQPAALGVPVGHALRREDGQALPGLRRGCRHPQAGQRAAGAAGRQPDRASSSRATAPLPGGCAPWG